MTHSDHNHCSLSETGDLAASGNEYRGFTYPSTHQSIYSSPLHPEPVRLPLRLRSGLRLIQGKLRRRTNSLISNSLINSPFAPLPAALCLCSKASAERHLVDCGLGSIFWLTCCGGAPLHRRVDFCLLFSTGWALIVRTDTIITVQSQIHIPRPLGRFPFPCIEGQNPGL